MTEAEWLASAGPKRLVEFMDRKASDRQFRLFASACCRFAWDAIPDNRSREAIVVAEQLAETGGVLSHIGNPIGMASFDAVNEAPSGEPVQKGAAAANILLTSQEWGSGERYPKGSSGVTAALLMYVEWAIDTYNPDDLRKQAALFRCVVGNPFRPVAFAAEWQTGTVAALAKGMYESRDFATMPILADALQDAGCDNPDILGHCHSAEPHVRGCWVVDLVLAKE
jgi:hypothetical protein